MLGKLLKYELRATSRTMLPILGVMLLVSGLANFAVRWINMERLPAALSVVLGLTMTAFILGLISLGAITIFVMVARFSNNLLRGEGYITHTLPVSVHAQIWSKVLVTALWYAAALLTIVLSVVLLVLDVDFIRGLEDALGDVLRLFTDFNNVEVIAEVLALLFLESVSMSLMIFAALSVGHSISSRKMLASVGVFILFVILTQIVSGVRVSLIEDTGVIAETVSYGFMEDWRLMCGHLAFGAVVSGAIYYLITAWFLKNRLNLE